MSPHVIEGSWEEIKRHEAEFVGHHLRVTITPQKPLPHQPKAPVKARLALPKAKKHPVRGMFAGIISTEEYLREKREDTLREDRLLR